MPERHEQLTPPEKATIMLPRSELEPIPPATTHKLKYIGVTSQWKCGHWRCDCGYSLGDGRDKFLARCPLAAASNNNREGPNPLQKLGNPKTNDETLS